MDGGVYAGGAEGARSGRDGGATRHAIGSHAAPAFVDEQHCHRRLLLAVRSRRLGLIPGESSVSRKATLRGPAG
jgi:hypothetical protein